MGSSIEDSNWTGKDVIKILGIAVLGLGQFFILQNQGSNNAIDIKGHTSDIISIKSTVELVKDDVNENEKVNAVIITKLDILIDAFERMQDQNHN